MAEEQVNEAKSSYSQSPREPSIRSRNDFEPPITPVMPIEKVQSPKEQSSIASTLRTLPIATIPASSIKGSVQLSLKSQRSNKNESLEPVQVENKSLSLREDFKNKNEENLREDSLSSPNGRNNNNKIITKSPEEPTENTESLHDTPVYSNINKISNMSKILTDEANALRESIKSLSEGIVRTKQELKSQKEDVNFPYHLFLIEIIINKINMKCECFELDYNNLIIAATFLGKPPITLYDSSYGKIDDFSDINVGKSALFAMTYDKICSIQDFVINLTLTKQPPCSNCVSKIAETKIDYTKEFIELREELCKKWTKEQPNDNIMCTTSTPLNRNMYYLSCGDSGHSDSIGIIELATRMSFLGKEITTAFCASSKPKCTSVLTKEDNGMSMYSCQNVEMDGQGKILLDENTLTRKETPKSTHTASARGCESPLSQLSSRQGSAKQYLNKNDYIHRYQQDDLAKYDEIFTKMNTNELKIRVPKTTKIERMGKYDRIQELCSCEETPYNTGDQIQFGLPRELSYPDKSPNTYSTNLKYTYKGYDNRDRKIINVTPSNCPVPINMEKKVHPQQDVFILKIGKKLETRDKKTDLEIELVTPKAPSDKRIIDNNHISQQCSSSTLKDKSKSDTKKEKKAKKSKSNLTNKKGKTKSGTKSKKNK
ncbi:uncharacterized protein LOC126768398 [Nymphalis io]|uniref:uncharacterized protein LOC126768398 n=1 Tax=Inachis io TaxID=171585 RepID=UPI00216A0FDE|nr:uncharacterized protein LOC126768398 [Nymphalis io]